MKHENFLIIGNQLPELSKLNGHSHSIESKEKIKNTKNLEYIR
jgi:hypothetical protein